MRQLLALTLIAGLLALAPTPPVAAQGIGDAQVITERFTYDGSAVIYASGSVNYVRHCIDNGGAGTPPRQDNFLAIANIHVVTGQPTVEVRSVTCQGDPTPCWARCRRVRVRTDRGHRSEPPGVAAGLLRRRGR